MSEYQYYEFVAVDQSLTEADQEALRALSSRAQITATRFTNTYNYGDFRGDAAKVLTRWFDAHVYVSNFGLMRVMFRLPKAAVDLRAWGPYLGRAASAKSVGRHVIVTFEWRDEEGGGWADEVEAEGWMPALLPLRAQLLRGDLAPLYVAWLSDASRDAGERDDEDDRDDTRVEPPVPPGLRAPGAALRAMLDFLGVSVDLFDAAAEASGDDATRSLDARAAAAWVAKLAAAERNALLTRVLLGEGARVEAALVQRHSAEQRAKAGGATRASRTFAEIAERAATIEEERARKKTAQRARELARLARAEAAEREMRLDALATRKAAAWGQVASSLALRSASGYVQAVALLADLAELAKRERDATFRAALAALVARHPSAALQRRLKAAALL